MRVAFIAALLLILGYYLLREPFKIRPHRAYRPNFLMVGLTLVVLIPIGVLEVQWQIAEIRGTQIVKEVSGKDQGKLKCQRFTETIYDTRPALQGYVDYDTPDVATLKWKQCKQLQKYWSHPVSPEKKETLALQVLIHESIHVKGNRDESSTECEALYNHLKYAKGVGSDMDVVTNNMRDYIKNTYAYMPSQYRGDSRCSDPDMIFPLNADGT